MIEFIHNTGPMTFSDVAINGFFINDSGELCQKNSFETYCVIANLRGEPYSEYVEGVPGQMQVTILPAVKKIKF